MIPTTTHKGYKITFDEVLEKWRCAEIDKSSPNLQNVKSQIDTFLRKERKEASVQAFELNAMWANMNLKQDAKVATLSPAVVVEYLGEPNSRSAYGPKGVQVAIMPKGRSRKTVDLNKIYKATKENEEIVRRAQEKGLEAVLAINQMKLILQELEALEESDVKDLIALSKVSEDE